MCMYVYNFNLFMTEKTPLSPTLPLCKSTCWLILSKMSFHFPSSKKIRAYSTVLEDILT